MSSAQRSVLALSGGVGGAKLALGLADELTPGQLHVLVNTGDDFEHLGLHISPDIDTLLYTLAGLANEKLGWGLAGETFNAMEALERLGGETWFRLGDKDMATHLWRTRQLQQGKSLGEVTAGLAQQLGVHTHVHPMTEESVRTTVHCVGENLNFQHYFVREQCEPAVTGFSFEGISAARPNRDTMRLLRDNAFSSVVICPSNPFVSVDPILQVPGFVAGAARQPGTGSTGIPHCGGPGYQGPRRQDDGGVGGAGHGAGRCAALLCPLPGTFGLLVIDDSDATLADEIGKLGVEVAVTSTVMKSREDKQRLARFTLQLGEVR